MRKYVVTLVNDVATPKPCIIVGRAFRLRLWCYGQHYAQGSGRPFRDAIRYAPPLERCSVVGFACVNSTSLTHRSLTQNAETERKH